MWINPEIWQNLLQLNNLLGAVYTAPILMYFLDRGFVSGKSSCIVSEIAVY